MRPCDLFMVDALQGVASLTVGVTSNGARSCKVQLIGSSVNTSIDHMRDQFVKSFSIESPEKGKRGVIAVIVEDQFSSLLHAIFVEVRREGEKINVITGDTFVPDTGRLGHIDNYGTITVKVDDIIFTNKFPSKFCDSHPKYALVDADSLCRYMVSMINKDQLKKASIECVEMQTKDAQITDLKIQLGDVQDKLLDEQVACSDLQVRCAEFMEELGEYHVKVSVISETNRELLLDSEKMKKLEDKLQRYVQEINLFRAERAKRFMFLSQPVDDFLDAMKALELER